MRISPIFRVSPGVRIGTLSTPSQDAASIAEAGNIDTPMHFNALAVEAEKRGISAEAMREIEWAKIPMGRPAATTEIASAIHFLSTDDASYFVGATLDVNGGMLIH